MKEKIFKAEQMMTPEEKEATKEREISARLERLFGQFSEKINEGEDGVIYKVDTQNAEAAAEIKALEELGIKLGGEQAIKLFKLYHPDKAREEYEIQKEARDLLENKKEEGKSYAGIAKPYLHKDISIHPEIKAKLREDLVEPAEDRVGIIVMDYIEGEELLKMISRDALKSYCQAMKAEFNIGDPRGRAYDFFARFPELQNSEKGDSERIIDQMRPENIEQIINILGGEEQLYSFLKRRGIKYSPTVSEQVENTLKLLHANGLTWRDGHERNIMIAGDPKGAKARVYIVDFGRAKKFEGDYDEAKEALLEAGSEVGGQERRVISDETIIARLRKVTGKA